MTPTPRSQQFPAAGGAAGRTRREKKKVVVVVVVAAAAADFMVIFYIDFCSISHLEVSVLVVLVLRMSQITHT